MQLNRAPADGRSLLRIGADVLVDEAVLGGGGFRRARGQSVLRGKEGLQRHPVLRQSLHRPAKCECRDSGIIPAVHFLSIIIKSEEIGVPDDQWIPPSHVSSM